MKSCRKQHIAWKELVWAELGDAPLACAVEHPGMLSEIKDQLLKAIRYVARHNPDARVETVWLTINQMAELFPVNKSGISRHLKNMYESGELVQAATVAKFATV
jgi:predicted Zn-dependent peptidase